jgi:hypothetical protein
LYFFLAFFFFAGATCGALRIEAFADTAADLYTMTEVRADFTCVTAAIGMLAASTATGKAAWAGAETASRPPPPKRAVVAAMVPDLFIAVFMIRLSRVAT